ncbi:MAG: hypothetical protein RIB61_06455 [Roseicyclus sp.]|jgi:NADH:ubiquinone oxidoreductase subunit K
MTLLHLIVVIAPLMSGFLLGYFMSQRLSVRAGMLSTFALIAAAALLLVMFDPMTVVGQVLVPMVVLAVAAPGCALGTAVAAILQRGRRNKPEDTTTR